MTDFADLPRLARLLATLGIAAVWLGLTPLAAWLFDAGGAGARLLGLLLCLVVAGIPLLFLALYQAEPHTLAVSSVALFVVFLIVPFMIPTAVLVTNGRDVPTLVTGNRCNELDCPRQVRLADPATQEDLGWHDDCTDGRLRPGDRVTTRVDPYGWFTGQLRPCLEGSAGLYITAGWIVALVIAAYLAYLCRIALGTGDGTIAPYHRRTP
jgi:hypothetical protein